jgi:hypothetical protein
MEGLLLDALATVRTSRQRDLTRGLAAVRGPTGEGDGLVVAVFGELTPEEARTVAAVRRGTATFIAVLVETGAAGAGGAQSAGDGARRESGPAQLLRSAGWRVVGVRSAADLAGAWALADQATEDWDDGRTEGSRAAKSTAGDGA